MVNNKLVLFTSKQKVCHCFFLFSGAKVLLFYYYAKQSTKILRKTRINILFSIFFQKYLVISKKSSTFAVAFVNKGEYGGYSSVGRASDCGSECRGFEPHYPPKKERDTFWYIALFL